MLSNGWPSILTDLFISLSKTDYVFQQAFFIRSQTRSSISVSLGVYIIVKVTACYSSLSVLTANMIFRSCIGFCHHYNRPNKFC